MKSSARWNRSCPSLKKTNPATLPGLAGGEENLADGGWSGQLLRGVPGSLINACLVAPATVCDCAKQMRPMRRGTQQPVVGPSRRGAARPHRR